MEKFFIVINGANEDSWSAWVWNDVAKRAQIYLDNNNLENSFLKKLKKWHFGNKLNKYFWIPFKQIWNRTLCIQMEQLNEKDSNYIIFQSTIKFSPSYIAQLKKRKNCKIVLYLPDTIGNLGIAKSRSAFQRYCSYYKIDKVFSFDKKDCELYDLEFFDIYSTKKMEEDTKNASDLFYVGSCRSQDRYKLLIRIFEKLKTTVDMNFYFVGVSDEQKKYSDCIKYNQFLKYEDVLKFTISSNCLLEIVNENQEGNTLRFKEAVCYNKKLLTNNKNVIKSKYYDPKFIHVFSDVNNIDTKWLKEKVDVDYSYCGDFSPLRLLDLIVSKCN